MCQWFSAWKGEGTIHRTEPKYAAIPPWISGLCWGIMSWIPSRSTVQVTSQERGCQGCRVRVFFKEKHQDATQSPGSFLSCPSLICISAPGQLSLYPQQTSTELKTRLNCCKQLSGAKLVFLKAFWSISTLQCKLYCRYNLSITLFIYIYPRSWEEKARRHARQFFLQEFYQKANPYFPGVNFASGTDANQHLRQRGNYFAAHAIPPLSKLILHKTITQLETHELKNNNLKTVFNIASVWCLP